jgi:hypothetical protein
LIALQQWFEGIASESMPGPVCLTDSKCLIRVRKVLCHSVPVQFKLIAMTVRLITKLITSQHKTLVRVIS